VWDELLTSITPLSPQSDVPPRGLSLLPCYNPQRWNR
jgi:hypothetical protein